MRTECYGVLVAAYGHYGVYAQYIGRYPVPVYVQYRNGAWTNKTNIRYSVLRTHIEKADLNTNERSRISKNSKSHVLSSQVSFCIGRIMQYQAFVAISVFARSIDLVRFSPWSYVQIERPDRKGRIAQRNAILCLVLRQGFIRPPAISYSVVQSLN